MNNVKNAKIGTKNKGITGTPQITERIYKNKNSACYRCSGFDKETKYCFRKGFKIKNSILGKCEEFSKRQYGKKKPRNKSKKIRFIVSPEEHLKILKEYADNKTKFKGNDIIYLLPKNAIMIAEYRKETDDVKIMIQGRDIYLYKRNINNLLNKGIKAVDKNESITTDTI